MTTAATAVASPTAGRTAAKPAANGTQTPASSVDVPSEVHATTMIPVTKNVAATHAAATEPDA